MRTIYQSLAEGSLRRRGCQSLPMWMGVCTKKGKKEQVPVEEMNWF